MRTGPPIISGLSHFLLYPPPPRQPRPVPPSLPPPAASTRDHVGGIVGSSATLHASSRSSLLSEARPISRANRDKVVGEFSLILPANRIDFQSYSPVLLHPPSPAPTPRPSSPLPSSVMGFSSPVPGRHERADERKSPFSRWPRLPPSPLPPLHLPAARSVGRYARALVPSARSFSCFRFITFPRAIRRKYRRAIRVEGVKKDGPSVLMGLVRVLRFFGIVLTVG